MANRRGRQVYMYSPNEIERLKGVPLPEKIPCSRCNKIKDKVFYSEKQLTDYRWHISKSVRDPKRPSCRDCTGGKEVVEIECTMCHKTKGKEDFARSQRAKPDTAQCFKCTEDQVTHQPYSEDRYEDASKPFVTGDTSNGIAPDYWSSLGSTRGSSVSNDWATVNGDTTDSGGGLQLSTNFQRMALSGSVTESLIDSEYAYPIPDNSSNVNGSGSSRVTQSWHTGPANAGPSNIPNSTFNPHAYGGPSTASNAGTERTYASSRVERSEAPEVRPNGWARVGAYGPSSHPRDAALPVGCGSATLSTGPVHSPFVLPARDTERECEADTNPWGSDDDGEEEADSDSDGDNTII